MVNKAKAKKTSIHIATLQVTPEASDNGGQNDTHNDSDD
jgi:hypothetical protein